MAPQPISSPRRPTGPATGCLVVFFSVFALLGALGFWAATVRPILAAHGARSWQEMSPSLLTGLFPLLFFAIGAGGITWALYSARKPPQPQADPAAAFGIAPPAGAGSGPLDLRPTATPLGKFVGVTLITLFWDGIVSVFVFQMARDWRQGSRADGCSVLFLVPFVLVGLLLIFATLRQLLVLFNPRVHLTLDPGVLTVGGSGILQWRLSSRGAGVRRLHIRLEGREEAWHQSGKSTVTRRNRFASVLLADTAAEAEIPSGSARIEVPVDTVPSFKAAHNKIIWSLKVTCEIAGWPDSDDEYEVLVEPARTDGGWA